MTLADWINRHHAAARAFVAADNEGTRKELELCAHGVVYWSKAVSRAVKREAAAALDAARKV
jgi:hypothetical protein